MKIVIYKENKPGMSDPDRIDHWIKFPKKTKVISLDPTIQILFVLDKDISDTRKILNVCRPWNYVRVVVYEGGLGGYSGYYDKISEYQPIDNYIICKFPEIIYIQPLYFENPGLKGNKEIELIKNNIPQGIMPHWEFRKNNGRIYGGFRKKGCLDVCIWEDKVRLEYYRKWSSNPKGKYTYTFKTVEEALPMINKIIKEMGYV